jgi:hypothetical protein
MACPGSIRLSVGQPNESSIYAMEGTAAHELAERCVRANFRDAIDYLGDIITVEGRPFEVTEDMAEAVQVWVDTIQADYEKGDILFVEQRFDLSNAVHPGMFGTNDCGLYKRKLQKLIVYDYKHGAGYAVEARENPQLCYYGVGMLNEGELIGLPLDSVELVIVQPRAPHRDGPVRRWLTDVTYLVDFISNLRAAAIKTEDPSAVLDAGPWCKFCPAAGICPELREQATQAAQAEFGVMPSELTTADISALLEKASLIEDWLKAIRREAFSRAQGGDKVPGWKLVDKRAVRKWTNEDEALLGLSIDFDLDHDDLTTTKLKSPAQVEKLLPKALRADMAALVTKASSGITFAREADRRAEVSPQRAAELEFDPVED